MIDLDYAVSAGPARRIAGLANVIGGVYFHVREAFLTPAQTGVISKRSAPLLGAFSFKIADAFRMSAGNGRERPGMAEN
jgi:hypothetical protein